MIKNLFSRYEWFVRLDDDAYVDTHKLQTLLAGYNSSKLIYLGSAGFGRDADDYVDISKGENYCMVKRCKVNKLSIKICYFAYWFILIFLYILSKLSA